MARYVEVDELKAKINANAWSNPVVPIYVNKVIDRTPTADVAPRSEVAREIIDEIRRTIDANAKVGLSSALILAAINNKLIFLEQKYTEEQK